MELTLEAGRTGSNREDRPVKREDLADATCGIAQALGVVGEWWTFLVVREVAGGTTRFDGIQAALGISRRALSDRLAHLVEHGVLARAPYSERPVRHDYLLTAKGEGLLPVLLALQEFGDRHVLGDGSLSATAAATSAEAQRVHNLVGTTSVDLALPAHTGEEVRLRPRDGWWRVVYFFPGAFAPGARAYPSGWGDIPGAAGCTLESTTYAAHHEEFVAAGTDVVGISSQRTDQQAAFAEHASLPFTLLSDVDLSVGTALRLPAFRVAGTDRYKRQTLLVDPTGTVRHVQMPITDPAGSVTEMLALVRALTS
jgi:peroxiredoxin/DNA-binding HxlR family transcriptional regulator